MINKKIFLPLLLAGTMLHATVATEESVTRLYVGNFYRAPDAAGLKYWLDTGLELESISSSFFDQKEMQDKYPAGYSDIDFVNQVYLNLFVRSPDSEGLDYWVGELESGAITRDMFILATINGAQGDDASIMANKTKTGLSFAHSGHNDVDQAEAVIKPITSDPKTVTDTLCSTGLGECYQDTEKPAEDTPDTETPTDTTPIADGPNQAPVVAPTIAPTVVWSTATEADVVVTANATDSDGTIGTYLWTIPTNGGLGSETTNASTLTINTKNITFASNPINTTDINYTYRVVVADNDGATTEANATLVTKFNDVPVISGFTAVTSGDTAYACNSGNLVDGIIFTITPTVTTTDPDATKTYFWYENNNDSTAINESESYVITGSSDTVELNTDCTTLSASSSLKVTDSHEAVSAAKSLVWATP